MTVIHKTELNSSGSVQQCDWKCLLLYHFPCLKAEVWFNADKETNRCALYSMLHAACNNSREKEREQQPVIEFCQETFCSCVWVKQDVCFRCLHLGYINMSVFSFPFHAEDILTQIKYPAFHGYWVFFCWCPVLTDIGTLAPEDVDAAAWSLFFILSILV